jgi:hypothetical protein
MDFLSICFNPLKTKKNKTKNEKKEEKNMKRGGISIKWMLL